MKMYFNLEIACNTFSHYVLLILFKMWGVLGESGPLFEKNPPAVGLS